MRKKQVKRRISSGRLQLIELKAARAEDARLIESLRGQISGLQVANAEFNRRDRVLRGFVKRATRRRGGFVTDVLMQDVSLWAEENAAGKGPCAIEIGATISFWLGDKITADCEATFLMPIHLLAQAGIAYRQGSRRLSH